MHTLNCVGRDKQSRVFNYKELDDGVGSLDFRVLHPAHLVSGNAFDFSLRARDDGTYQVIIMKHHNVPEYVAMGIPEALILELAYQLHARIVSSPGKGESGEFRQPGATKVWERLRERGQADYDPATDTYSTL